MYTLSFKVQFYDEHIGIKQLSYQDLIFCNSIYWKFNIKVYSIQFLASITFLKREERRRAVREGEMKRGQGEGGKEMRGEERKGANDNFDPLAQGSACLFSNSCCCLGEVVESSGGGFLLEHVTESGLWVFLVSCQFMFVISWLCVMMWAPSFPNLSACPQLVSVHPTMMDSYPLEQ